MPEISATWWLTTIGLIVVLLITTVASLVKVRRDPSARTHAGSLRHHDQDRSEADRGGRRSQ